MEAVSSPYKVLGAGVAPLLGRKKDKSKILRRFSKLSPDHVSLVGPRYIGKTVLLKALAESIPSESSIDVCLYWDLRHNSPKSDEEFYEQFALRLRSHVGKIDPALATCFEGEDSSSFYALKSLFEILSEESKVMLIILDGLDTVLQNVDIRKDLWDSLRALADMPGFRMLTGTRAPLRELCLRQDSRTSDFFNVFGMNSERLGPLDPEDVQDFLHPFAERGFVIDSTTAANLGKWCGSNPLFTAAVCFYVWQNCDRSKVLDDEIDRLANDLYMNESMQDYLHDCFWRNSNERERALLTEIVRSPLRDKNENDPSLQSLLQKGLITKCVNGFTCSSALVAKYCAEQGESVTSLRALFGTERQFFESAPALLELRLSQLENVDETLRTHIETVIHFLHEPIEGAKQIRMISDRAYSIVFENETPTGMLPEQWLEEWRRGGLGQIPPRNIPREDERLSRFHLIRNIADTRYRLQNRRLTPDLHLLLSHMKLFGDFGFHPSGHDPSSPLMFTIGVSAIELARQLREVYS